MWKESHLVLAISSILFSNYYALFANVYYLQYLFSENNIITDDAQRRNTFYTFQTKSLHITARYFFKFFLEKIKNL